ncbi:MAG TPA: hypothetical protein PKN69_09840 [Candidatus Latescibacteria bacterium]|nr:hypothetical protein [Candidatus Latescibacterota bacterium]
MPEISWGVLGNPLWTLCEAIRLSEQITPPDEPHFRVPKKAEAEEESRRSPKTILEVLQEAANYPLHEVVANPVCGMVLNAIEAGDLATVPKMSERKDTDLEYCAKLKVRPLEYLRWRASIPSAPPLPAELQRYLDAHSAPKRGKQHGNT